MSITIAIFLRVDQVEKTKGRASITLRCTIDRKKADISLKKYLSPKKAISIERLKQLTIEERLKYYHWDSDKEELTKGASNYEKINFFLAKEKSRAVDIILKYELQGKQINKELFKKEFKGQKGSNANAFEYFEEELKARKKDYSDETYRSYGSILTKLRDYSPNITLKELNHKFLTDYENYMVASKEEGGKGNEKRTAANNMKVIKTFVNIAKKNKDIPEVVEPFENIKIKKYKGESKRKFLDQFELEEVEKLINNYKPLTKPMQDLSPEDWKKREKTKLLTPAEYNVLSYFLFSCYTGLRFQDVKDLQYSAIKWRRVREGNTLKFTNKVYIEIDMHKTGFPVMIPLLKKAQKLIDLSKKEGKVFKVISNQKTNEHLKKIIASLGIEKKITFHCSRHTFATVGLIYGIPQRVIQNILGHQNSETTEIYSHLVDDFLFNKMDEFEQKLNKQHQKTEDDQSDPLNLNQSNDLLKKLSSLDASKLEKLISLAELIS